MGFFVELSKSVLTAQSHTNLVLSIPGVRCGWIIEGVLNFITYPGLAARVLAQWPDG